MKRFLILLLLTGCTSLTVSKEVPKVCHGQDVLGLARQDIQMITENWEDGECLGVLASTFGPIFKDVETIIKNNEVPAVRYHLSFCNHNNQCQDGECQLYDLKCMGKKASRIENLHKRYLNTQCFISPRLEYSEKDCSIVNAWFDTVRKNAPSCILVASPMGNACVPADVLEERHGNKPPQAAIVSNDGDNYFDSDSTNYNGKGRVLNLKWTPRNNLRLTSEKDAPLPPKKRPLTNRLQKNDLLQMQLMKNDLPPVPTPPAFCKNMYTLKNGETWKNHSEDYGAKNDSRGNKPLLIYHKKVPLLNVYDKKGKKISCLKYYGPFEKLHRHYMGSCSGDDAYTLYNKANGEWAFVKDNDTCIAVPTIRRWGTFR